MMATVTSSLLYSTSLDEEVVVDGEVEHGVDGHVLLVQQVVEDLRLRHRAREPVQNKSFPCKRSRGII